MTTNNAMDSRQFRTALGAFTTGVTIVTTRDSAGHDIGLTANSFNSVSLDPPLVLWSLAKSSLSMAAFIEAKYFAVHILAADQQALSDRFAKRGVDKFEGLSLERGPGEIPLLDGCMARFQCRAAYQYAGGDHEIFVGEVVAFDHSDKEPLVFQAGGYGMLLKDKPAVPADSDAADSSFYRDYLGYLLGSPFHQMTSLINDKVAEKGLDKAEHLVLSILSTQKDRTLAEVDALVTIAGQKLSEQTLQSLQNRGYITRVGADRVDLTEAGLSVAIEMLAFGKSVEASMLSALDYRESQLLKSLLKRIARRGNNNLPPLWRKN